MRLALLALSGLIVLAACSGDEPGSTATSTGSAQSTGRPGTPSSDGLFPDVIAATAMMSGPGVWRFSATLSSPYDSPARYADAWRVLAPDGTELGVRVLAHDHAGEQPFTRVLSGVVVPADVERVTIEGRDQVNGWGGATVDVELRR